MRDTSLLIATFGVILGCVICPSHLQEIERSSHDDPVRMAAESLVVRTYRNSESTTSSSSLKPEKSDQSEEFQVYQGVMGKPGVDFPTYANIPATSFSCRGVKKSGYYADLATDCQVFHVCDGNRKISFLCPNGTIFRQSHLICDWWFRVDCGKSVELYDESAEQLEADQKIYKARAEERERRRKLVKTLTAETGGEVTSLEVIGLSDTLKTNNFPTKQVENTNFHAGSSKYPPFKSERQSKKNFFENNGETFPNNVKGKGTGKITESKEVNLSDIESKISFSNTKESNVLASTQKSVTPSYVNKAPNSFDSNIFKENIQGAESGSLVEDLANRSRNRNFGISENKENRENNEFKSRENSDYDRQNVSYKNKASNTEEKNNLKQEERFDLRNEAIQAKFSTTEKLNSNSFYNQQNLGINKSRKENEDYNKYQTYQNTNKNIDNKNKYQNVHFTYSNENNKGNLNLDKENKNSNNANNNFQGIYHQYNNYKESQISETTDNSRNFNGDPTPPAPKISYTNAPYFNDYTTIGVTDYDNKLKYTTFEYSTSQSPENFQSNLRKQNNFTNFTNRQAEKISINRDNEKPVSSVSINPTTFQNTNSAKSGDNNNYFGFGSNFQNYRGNQRDETTVYDGNINFNYNSNRDNLWFDYHGEKNSNSLKEKNGVTKNVESTYNTENLNQDGKRTNVFVKQETGVPTTQIKKNHSSRYRTSTVPYRGGEKQFYTQTPTFENNRGGKSYSEFNNYFQTYNKEIAKTTIQNPKTTPYFTTKAPSSEEEYSTVTEFYKTTYHWPVKKNSKKVTFRPGTEAQRIFPTTQWPTTFPPYYESTTTNAFTEDEIYFTSAVPDKEVEFIDEFSSVQDGTTRLENEVSTAKADIDITLQELDITKTTTPVNDKNKTYEDYVREGLEVPPSLGPNAIRSFALYFGISNNTTNIPDTTTFEPTTSPQHKTTIESFSELSRKDVLKQIDDLVQSNAVNKTELKIDSREDLLPNSLLTQHTKESYSALFSNSPSENLTTEAELEKKLISTTPLNVETTDFGSFTEEPFKINTELRKNDLDSSQSRGLVEPDPYSEDGNKKTSPDLRELAQVFTKALSAYLDDPEAFRKVLSEIRPTEPSLDPDRNGGTVQYPSAIKEDGEVLDFSDVTKSLYTKKAQSSTLNEKATTKLIIEETTTQTNIANEIENLVVPLNNHNITTWATNIELTAPLLESLDQSQSSYYTPPPAAIGTTNAIAEEINKFIEKDQSSLKVVNEVVDSYFPISSESPRLKYGGFQNNSIGTTKYSPYGSELTSSTSSSSGASPFTVATTSDLFKTTSTFTESSTSFYDDFSKNRTEEEEIQLAKELNNLILLPKFTTPRPTTPEFTTSAPHLSTFHVGRNEINQFRDINLGNGEILETNIPTRIGKALKISETKDNGNINSAVEEINLELSPPSTTPKGFLITYSLQSSSDTQAPTYLPKETTPTVIPTTYAPRKKNYFTTTTITPTTTDSFLTTVFRNVDNESDTTKEQNIIEYDATTQQTTQLFVGSTKSFDRIAELQETLMFNTNHPTIQQKDQARESVQKMMGSLNMTESTAHTLMKVMEMAAKNDTYRRLVLLLVNDKSGRNKTAEESRLSLLKALLTPVISVQQTRTNIPIPDPVKLAPIDPSRSDSVRRSKSIRQESSRNRITSSSISPTTLPPITTIRPKNNRRTKTSKIVPRVESNYRKSALGNLGTIKQTIENSRSKQVKLNSIDDAILNSDSRAIELLRSLYSLAARWG